MSSFSTWAAGLALGMGALHAQAAIMLPELMYYRFNEGVGATATTDQASSPVGTTPLTGLTIQGNGVAGSSALNGGTAAQRYGNTGWTSTLGSGNWTLAFWTGAAVNTSDLSYFFGDSSGFRGFTEGVAGPNGFIVRGGGLSDTLVSGLSTSTNNHIAFVYDSALDAVKGYLNGQLNVTTAQPGTFSFGGNFSIGGRGPAFAGNGLRTGVWMDEFQLYSRALSSADVVDAMNANFIGPNAVPEPGTPALLGLAALGLWATRRGRSGSRIGRQG